MGKWCGGGTRRGWFLAAVGGAFLWSPAAAQDSQALLLLPVGARASAMGGSMTALEGADAAYYNPAGLAGLDRNSAVLHHSRFGTTEQQLTAISLLVTPWNLSVEASYQLFDLAHVTTTNSSGQQTGEIAYRDHLVVLSAATPLAYGLSGGMGYRFYQQRVDCVGRCGGEERVETVHAVDIGAQYRPFWQPRLRIGLSAMNEPVAGSVGGFPERLSVGVAYDVLDRETAADRLRLRLSAELRDDGGDLGDPGIAVGGELDVQETIFLRAGHAPGEGLGTGTGLGVGVRYGDVSISLSRSFVNSQADLDPVQVSMRLDF